MLAYEKEQEEKEELERLKEEEKRKIQERVQNYSKYVKEMYWPKVSKTKQDELDEIRARLKNDIKSP